MAPSNPFHSGWRCSPLTSGLPLCFAVSLYELTLGSVIGKCDVLIFRVIIVVLVRAESALRELLFLVSYIIQFVYLNLIFNSLGNPTFKQYILYNISLPRNCISKYMIHCFVARNHISTSLRTLGWLQAIHSTF